MKMSSLRFQILGGLKLAAALVVPLLPILSHNAAATTDYYVSISGSDSNDGSQARPWRTIAHADAALRLGSSSGGTVVCGSTNVGACVHVLPGSYDVGGGLTTHATGTASQRVVFFSDTKWGAKITCGSGGTCWNQNGAYEDTVNFEVTQHSPSDAANYGMLSFMPHDRLIGNHVHDISVPGCAQGGAGITNGGNPGSPASFDDMIGNVVHDIGPPQSVSGTCNGAQGIYPTSSFGITENNIVYRVYVDGISVFHHVTNVVVSNNLVFNTGSFDHVHGNGINMDSQDGLGNTTVANNVSIHNNGTGLRCNGGGSTNTVFENNYVYGNNVNITAGVCILFNNVTTAPATSFVNYNSNPAAPTTSGGLIIFPNADYHLVSGSPMIGQGTMTCAANGSRPCIASADIDLNPRLNPPSIGAYEFATSSRPGVPSPPSGLTASVR